MSEIIGALREEEPVEEGEVCRDYEFTGEAKSVWIAVGNLLVYILKGEDGVKVNLYNEYDPMGRLLGSTFAVFEEEE